MQNEFYEVILSDGDFLSGPHFFKDKDKAFDFLWQQFFNAYADDYPAETLAWMKEDMYFWYEVGDFGEVVVRGFED